MFEDCCEGTESLSYAELDDTGEEIPAEKYTYSHSSVGENEDVMGPITGNGVNAPLFS